MSEADQCCNCGNPMPESVADWWLTSFGYYCTEECADASLGRSYTDAE